MQRKNKMFKLNENYFTLEQKDEFLNISMNNAEIVTSTKGKKSYFNIASAFDIETSSFYENGEKRAICYIWQFGLNGNVIIGRNLEEFKNFTFWLSRKLNLSEKRRLIVYVHNLGYEFQFIRKWFLWEESEYEKVVADKERSPIKATSKEFWIEFRCSYRLSGYSLESTAKNLTKYKVKKLVGNLDYEKIRHSKTILTPAELQYCINDVLVIMAYVQEEIENFNGIQNIPLTNTGKVRLYCKKACLGNGKNEGKKFKEYTRLMQKMTLTKEVYLALKRAFQGGFTHANAFYSGSEIDNVSSFDFTSSYPYVMIAFKYPMRSAFKIDSKNIKGYKDLKYYVEEFNCLMDIRLKNVVSKSLFGEIKDNFISVSKCMELKNPVIDNGRIVTADEFIITITEVDFWIICQAYKFKFEILNFYVFEKNYLPSNFIKAILKLYADKTELKGVEGKEIEYLRSKGMLNSCYGMSVTDIVRNSSVYDNYENDWIKDEKNIEDEIEKYNVKKDRFLFYAWGVWVTAYARYNLFNAILQLKNDYVYSDTDSVKFINLNKNQYIFDNYNKSVKEKLLQVSRELNIPIEQFKPKTIKGVKKMLGVFDYEGTFKKFKTLGAKRYMYLDDKNELHITVAGLSKKASKYLIEKYGIKKAFTMFRKGMIIPAEYAGRMTHIYLDGKDENGVDFEYTGVVTDYNGVACEYREKSAIHLEKASFELSIAEEYENFIEGNLKEVIIVDSV